MYKKAWCTCKVVGSAAIVAFLPFSLPLASLSPSSLLKLPIFWRKYAILHQIEALNDGFLLSEYIANTFWAVQSTLRPLEMHSDRRYKISICSAIFRELESFRHYKGFSIIFSKTLDAIWSWFLSPHIFEIHNFRFPLSTKYSLSCGRKCEKLNCRKS